MTKFDYSYGNTLLKCEGVGLTIGENVILRDISLEIKDIHRPGMTQGQVIGFAAPSGTGKSKFCEVLSGILTNNKEQNVHLTGSVLIGENQQPTTIGRVGFVQQKYPLLAHRTVQKNLELIADNKFKDKVISKQKVDYMLNMLGLEPQAKKYPANLSGGQQQRVAIAQALIACEDFLIFDEPFSGLDINMIAKVSQMIQELTTKSETLTIIVISHDISSICAISDTVWLMGRERDQQGNVIPGAKIMQEINLIERGLAWVPNIHLLPEFTDLTREIKAIFPSL